VNRSSGETDRASNFERTVSFVILALTFLFDIGLRFRLAPKPLEHDEGEYALLGQLMLDGIPPYVEAANMKCPGTDAMHAIGMLIFGQIPAGVHLSLLVVNVASLFLMFFIGTRMLGFFGGAIAAAALWSRLTPEMIGRTGWIDASI